MINNSYGYNNFKLPSNHGWELLNHQNMNFIRIKMFPPLITIFSNITHIIYSLHLYTRTLKHIQSTLVT